MSAKIRGADIAEGTITDAKLATATYDSVYIVGDHVIGAVPGGGPTGPTGPTGADGLPGGPTGPTGPTGTLSSGIITTVTAGVTWTHTGATATLLTADLNWSGGRHILVTGVAHLSYYVQAGWYDFIKVELGVYYNGAEISRIKYYSQREENPSTSGTYIFPLPIYALVPASIPGLGYPLTIAGIVQDSRKYGVGSPYIDLGVDATLNILEL